MSERMDAIGQNGNDGEHYEIKVGDYVKKKNNIDNAVYKVVGIEEQLDGAILHNIAGVIDTTSFFSHFYLNTLKIASKYEAKIFDENRDNFIKFNQKNEKPIQNKRSKVLDTAKDLINGERNGQYGNPQDNFATIAALWSDYLCEDVSTKDVAAMMILLKVARIKSGGSEDCWVDICGYAALGAEVE